MTRHAHLIGSVGLRDAETVFSTVSEILGPYCPRIPDGETGDRGYWIRWQRDTFASHLSFDEATTNSVPGFKDNMARTFYKLRKDAKPAQLELGELGYAREAEASYKIFARLVEAGKIAADVRFQVSLPTPAALVCGFIVESDREKVEPAVRRAMESELDLIQSLIPPDRLCIQWDVCYEIVGAEGKMQLPYDEAIAGSVERVAGLCSKVNPKAEVGIHLCYGDPGHKHIVEPKDLAISVAFAEGICRNSRRPVDFIHMPVPRGRSDGSYFAPLAELALPASTRLVLGLIHHTDGLDGAQRRIAAAERYVSHFDVATECGFGRRDPTTIHDLLHLHRALCTQ
jgi:hypothetical protein